MPSFCALQANQVGEVVRALGQNPTEADIRRLVQNNNNEGRVTFETFLPILHAVSQKQMTDTVDDFVEGLRHFDKVISVSRRKRPYGPMSARSWNIEEMNERTNEVGEREREGGGGGGQILDSQITVWWSSVFLEFLRNAREVIGTLSTRVGYIEKVFPLQKVCDDNPRNWGHSLRLRAVQYEHEVLVLFDNRRKSNCWVIWEWFEILCEATKLPRYHKFLEINLGLLNDYCFYAKSYFSPPIYGHHA